MLNELKEYGIEAIRFSTKGCNERETLSNKLKAYMAS